MDSLARSRFDAALARATLDLLAELGPPGHWSGKLSSSALSTATAVVALAIAQPVAYGKWTPGGLIAAGEKIGPSTAAFFQAVIAARPHPEQGFRTCLGILSLTRSYNNARVDAACRRGILIKARSVASIRSILKNGLDRAFLDETSDHQPLRHGNIRGQGYFH